MSANPIRQIHQALTRTWLTTEATVDSCAWASHSSFTGHYDVTFSYRPVNSDPVSGKFCCPGDRQIRPYHPGERIPIRYNPSHPKRFSLAEQEPRFEKLEAILVMALFALVAGFLLYAY